MQNKALYCGFINVSCSKYIIHICKLLKKIDKFYVKIKMGACYFCIIYTQFSIYSYIELDYIFSD